MSNDGDGLRELSGLVVPRVGSLEATGDLFEPYRLLDAGGVVASDIFGVSGREMMAALIAGERNPQVLAQLARASMRTKIPQLEEAFVGYFTEHHRFLLAKMLARIDAIDADIADLDTQIEAQLAPFAERRLAWTRSPELVPPRPR